MVVRWGRSIAIMEDALEQEKDILFMKEHTEFRCGNCGKLLGVGSVRDFTIKCPRCKTLNRLRTESPSSELPESQTEQSHGAS